MNTTEDIDPRAELLARIREKFIALDRQRADELALYVPLDALPHVALKNIRAFLYRLLGPEDTALALAIVGLDRVIDNLCACKPHIVYVRHDE
jgi:hypothetical protein